MTTQRLGSSDRTVSRLAYGCMRIVRSWNPADVDATRIADAHAMLDAAVESGYTLFDHADIYCHGECERVFGLWLDANRSIREKLLIATKCGVRFPGDPDPHSPHRYDFDPGHIRRSIESSLRRLRVDVIDLYQLHRPDVLMDPQAIAEVFVDLQETGKVRHFGVSNFSPSTLSALQAALPMRLMVNQVEISLTRLNCFVDGTLDQCLERRITPLSWSPMGGGVLAGERSVAPEHPSRAVLETLLATLGQVAGRLGTTPDVVALAWLLKHPAGIVPIVGSTRPLAIRRSVEADRLELSREDWYRLYTAARGQKLP